VTADTGVNCYGVHYEGKSEGCGVRGVIKPQLTYFKRCDEAFLRAVVDEIYTGKRANLSLANEAWIFLKWFGNRIICSPPHVGCFWYIENMCLPKNVYPKEVLEHCKKNNVPLPPDLVLELDSSRVDEFARGVRFYLKLRT
jgi:hypothetical protein